MRALDLHRLIRRRQSLVNQRRRSPSQKGARLGVTFSAAVSILAGLVILIVGLGYGSLIGDLPSLEQIPALLNAEDGLFLQPTAIYDRSGAKLLLKLENPGIPRRYLPLNPDAEEFLAPTVIQVTVARMEPDFWTSPGFARRNLTSPQPLTIAEHLVDSLLLWNEVPGLRHTLHLRLLSAQLVSQYGRSQVLEWYLNSAYYGRMAYGVDSAAWLYFNKPASDLNMAEAAMLVAASETPALNPLDSPTAARERQQAVLEQLLEAGLVSQEEYAQASQVEVALRPVYEPQAQTARAFSRLVLEQLSAHIDNRRLEMGGLRIITTLDGDLQAQLVCAMQVQLHRLQGEASDQSILASDDCKAARLLPTMPPLETYFPDDLTASGIVLDPQTGQVLAYLGRTTIQSESTSLAGYQPGSLLTPFVAVAGFTRGYSPASLVWDIEASLPEDLSAFQNPDGMYHGPQRLRMTLVNDYLSPIAQLLAQFGPRDVWRLAAKFGISGLAETDAPLELIYSGGEVTTLQAAQGYAVFANSGVSIGRASPNEPGLQPVLVLSVEEANGRNWYQEPPPESRFILSEEITYLVHQILSDDVARRPSLGYPNSLEIANPSAAKIGRVDGSRQVWAAGYTRQRVAVMWLGLPEDSETDLQLDGRAVAGLWHAAMQYANRELPAEDWDSPQSVVFMDVCDPSGQLPTNICPSIVNEVFLSGAEPTILDTLYRVFQVNQETGRLATVFTPLELVEEKVYLITPPEAAGWAEISGLPKPPEDYDAIQPSAFYDFTLIDRPGLFDYVRAETIIRGTASGEGFVSYRLQVGAGLNPLSWQQIGEDQSEPVEEGILGVWDTTGLEGLYALRLVVQRENQAIETVVTQITIDNTPPQVTIPYPVDGQIFSLAEQAEITLQADVQDGIGVRQVVWIVDSEEISDRSQPPYTLSWPLKIGEHTFEVKAYDVAGHVTYSEPTKITVEP
jgi:membrane peptidoglycan carboxypeptidase